MNDFQKGTAIQPIEQLVIDASLDGRHGTNRSTQALKQISADHDAAAIMTWLDDFYDSLETQRNYRKEAERLLLWSLIERRKPLSSLTREDMSAYHAFLAAPSPQVLWCGPRLPRNNPAWKPFQGPLSDSSRAQALTIVNVLFNYLVEAGYLMGNPLGLLGEMRTFPQICSLGA